MSLYQFIHNVGPKAGKEPAAHHEFRGSLCHSIGVSVHFKGKSLGSSLRLISDVVVFDCVNDTRFTDKLSVQLEHDVLEGPVSYDSCRSYDFTEEPQTRGPLQTCG